MFNLILVICILVTGLDPPNRHFTEDAYITVCPPDRPSSYHYTISIISETATIFSIPVRDNITWVNTDIGYPKSKPELVTQVPNQRNFKFRR